MTARTPCLFFFLCCLGCHTLVPPGLGDSPAPAADAEEPVSPAPRTVEANTPAPFKERPPPAEQAQAVNHLGLAATCLEKGDETGALPHLACYLAVHPEHLVVRAHYAELLLRLHRD